MLLSFVKHPSGRFLDDLQESDTVLAVQQLSRPNQTGAAMRAERGAINANNQVENP